MRPTNNWMYKMDQVSDVELTEVMAINSMVPYLLISRLKENMCCSDSYAHIINGSSP